jgi:mono/diheme cytochrome c family protein
MMTKTSTAAIALFGVALAFSVTARGQEAAAPATVWDKVYTEEQATRGKDAYMTECSACHSEDLGGSGYAPALKGNDFAFAWGEKTVGDFFTRIRRLMPPDNPGSLAPEKYRDIVAFILRENTYPAGEHELSAEPSALNAIKITAPPK